MLREIALSYHTMSGLYFLAVIFAATIVSVQNSHSTEYNVHLATAIANFR